MSVRLNHTIVWCRDRERSSAFFTDVFGLPPATRFGPFAVVELANDLSLDYHETSEDIAPQHYAFLVGDDEWDEIFDRVTGRGIDYWADPGKSQPGSVNHHDAGKGVYFEDPDGHLLEIITRPYGSGG